MSDIDGNNRMPDFVKCDAIKVDDSAETNSIETQQSGRSHTRRVKQTVKSERPTNKNGINGFLIDAENRYHCLDCGKRFKQKASYNQHQRL